VCLTFLRIDKSSKTNNRLNNLTMSCYKYISDDQKDDRYYEKRFRHRSRNWNSIDGMID